MQLKRYSSKESVIFIWFLLPYVVVINLLLFGPCVFSSLTHFLLRFIVSAVYFAGIYALFGMVAMLVKKRLPDDGELFRRIAILLPLFYAMNILTVQGAYLVYERQVWMSCGPRRSMEWWVTGFGCMASTILTFLNEAAVGWDKWKTAVTETGQLRSAYQRSRLLSLKRQINPHFLFNSFNTLSSLIHEDEKQAEQFLNEMTRVYRYLLKSDEEQLVSLQEELKFIGSYLYLNKVRFGSALEVKIDVEEGEDHKKLPPLSLQIILDNIIYRNAFSKSSPILIELYTNRKSALVIKNTLHPKPVRDVLEYEEALDNLVNKYKLLYKPRVQVYETATHRIVVLPLIDKEEVVL
ncbi:MAG: histidine kinase [Chitinophagaceae bacterium]